VAPGCDADAIREEARRLLEGQGKIRKGPRVLPRERAVDVRLVPPPADPEALRVRFRERTGFELRLDA
jgi:hypothetical protein